ncbi:MAG: hypothetical protein F4193_06935 [Candidatus Dadabacteria bacterium]|nr:hypothetical protein [Gammaproteobacteria bacterium]MYG83535.1 hypothetical protein [Candidatus Dadabacteria bacterium]
MPLNVSYMGTKRRIADRVAQIVDTQRKGPLLDLFAGMCSVSTAVGQSRPVWCNDVQKFASSVATAFFTSPPLSFDSKHVVNLITPLYELNSSKLLSRFAHELFQEELAFDSSDVSQIRSLEQHMPNVAANEAFFLERVTLARYPFASPYRLFAITYSGGYFGLAQSIEIDSIRYAIDQLYANSVISIADHRWLCLAICQAASRVATTTGHFAQHMRVNEHNLARFIAQRRREVWSEWLRAVYENHPVGTTSWRASNRVFRQDATGLLDDLQNDDAIPAVVYADPPYTRDQYSRYYHVYETLLQYDYPQSYGSGRYRPDRFRSPYSMKTRVGEAMKGLISRCAKLGSSLVLSYPERGMLDHSDEVIPTLLRRHYGRKPQVHMVTSSHSSFGASKGRQNYTVQERIYVAN